jgi:hypothetical protein
MGFLSAIILLPLAPLRGTIWLAERLAEVAERDLDSDTTLRRLLVEAEMAYDSGELSLEEYEQVEDELLERLEHVREGATQ